MKLIVGLGNPGDEYKNTKHNVGFWVIDKIAQELKLNLDKQKFNGIFAKADDYILAKPLTYMNNSGLFVQKIAHFFKISNDDILIIYDDMDFSIGQAAIKNNGSAAGHNGMKDIIEQLGTEQIKRLKIGISRPLNKENKNYVLTPFNNEEQKIIEKVVETAADAAIQFLSNDIRIIVERFNAKNKKRKDSFSS
ncbi:aminoacyl-tRNA hydrolase [Mesomycoplasma lagogenitalium]|uniref:Peptidyl-tRNA hydrolase n=1 Tax=Mesomycoplasma lagogenitalium TaxID=171286 RepID=A0ABY8LTQ6_9BACT|nr:aminoacyl-tRNA hydrolase [Mesomycoplasma lagogenitalium]WGI36621.1 aminoacyl-tRNA hydrolase [Mesomycoplasma lagogenitalium]